MDESTVSILQWARLSELIAARLGLHFPPAGWLDLQRSVARAAVELGHADSAACVERLLSAVLTKAELNVLASHLTIGETYFFREKNVFEALAQNVLPEMIRDRRNCGRRLRIWSAACCTGEEAYSLAILLHQVLPDLADWDVTILATDINPQFLQKAADGVYGEWSFRDSLAGFKERYFRRTGNGLYAVLPEIRKRVIFKHLNLVEDVFPEVVAMDLIFCRNVLMYFTAVQARKAAVNLRGALVDGGWLAVSSTEGSQLLFSQFAPVNFPGVVLYRNGGRAEEAARPPPMAEFALCEPFIPWELPMPVVLGKSALEDEPTASSPEPPLEACSAAARAFADEGKLEEALECCERWLAADKLNTPGHYLRATVLQELGNSREARRSFQRAIYLTPDFVLAHFALGNLARATARIEEAEKHFANALNLLHRRQPEELLPEAGGLTARRLKEIISSLGSLKSAP